MSKLMLALLSQVSGRAAFVVRFLPSASSGQSGQLFRSGRTGRLCLLRKNSNEPFVVSETSKASAVESIRRRCLLSLFILTAPVATLATTKVSEPEWMNIIIHGTVGFQANFSYKTILQAKNDCIEGTDYERNVLAIREHPYLFALQPMQKLGLHHIKQEQTLSASYAFAELYQDVQNHCGISEKSQFYTFGWSGLISKKRRHAEARILYKKIKGLVLTNKKKGTASKIRLIAYSHGATLALNLADIRSCEFPTDTFAIDEIFLVGLPVTRTSLQHVVSPIFKQVYHIYSHGDKVQHLDVFSSEEFFSHREFKGCLPESLTQIEMKVTSCFRKSPHYCLPARMRGMFNQSPGHIELWFFGWAPSSYRKNLGMFPMPGAVFIPYLVCAASKIRCKHIQVDIRPEQEKLCIRPKYNNWDCIQVTMPFMSQGQYTQLICKAMEFHPSNPKYKESFLQMQGSIDVNAYK